MSAVIADTSSISCTCCCALSHGGTWQLPIRPYLLTRCSTQSCLTPGRALAERRGDISACGELGGRQRDYVAIGRAQRPRRLEQRRRISWIDVDAPRQIPRAVTLAEIHDEKRALEGVGARPQRRPRLCVEDRERVEQQLPMLDGNGRQQRVLLRRRLCRHARCDAAQRTRLPGERRLRATR